MLRYAILTHLATLPLTGYDLDRRLDDARGSVWHASHSQIYTELRRLEAEGLVSATDVPQTGKPDKRVYRITGEGRRQLKEYALSPIELPPGRDPAHLHILNAGRVPLDDGLAILRQVRDAYSERLATMHHYRDYLAREGLDLDAPLSQAFGSVLSVEIAIRGYAAVIESCDWAADQLRAAHARKMEKGARSRVPARRD